MAAPAEERTLGPALENLTPRAAAALFRDHVHPTSARAFARSSPGKLLALGVVAIVLCLLAGTVTAVTAGDRRANLDVQLAETEPFAYSAQRLYLSLSIADAAAGTAFIYGGLEPLSVRETYLQALGDAAAESTGVAGDEQPGSPARDALIGIATQLPVYAGTIETARANNRLGLPVGSAYLGEASNLMQSTVLPDAEQLYEERAATISTTLQRYEQPPWPAIGLLAAALLGLVLIQMYLLRRWRRVFNPGMIVASFAMLALLAWMTIGASVAAADTRKALDQGNTPLTTLTHARILAQQARSGETLKLSRRDTTGEYDQAYDANVAELRTLLADYPSDAPAADLVRDAQTPLDGWIAAHGRMNDAFGRADYTGAATIAIGSDPDDSTAQFTALDDDLEQGITQTRAELRDEVARASRMLDGLVVGAILLALGGSMFVALGLWPRLREYR
ncbi:MAG TPA: hypothetical protein VIW24_30575 [Aldersonia sp.]